MAEVPVRKDRSQERGVSSRGTWNDYSGSPWSMMRRFGEDIDRWFGGGQSGRGGFWSPNIDVREEHNQIVVNADLPGLSKDDVKVEVTNEGLTIQGERKSEQEERREGYYRSERSFGSFCRVVPLPEGANVEQAHAQFRDGVLEVTVPIPESARKRREIPIEAAPKTRTSGGGQ